jgi:hypothetical protein
MDNQDWTPVVLRRTYSKKEAVSVAGAQGRLTTVARDSNKAEKIRLARLDAADEGGPLKKKRVDPVAVQELIRKRVEMKLTQDKADALCSFPKHTFREIETGRLVPSEDQKRRIHMNMSVGLRTIDA